MPGDDQREQFRQHFDRTVAPRVYPTANERERGNLRCVLTRNLFAANRSFADPLVIYFAYLLEASFSRTERDIYIYITFLYKHTRRFSNVQKNGKPGTRASSKKVSISCDYSDSFLCNCRYQTSIDGYYITHR